MNEKKQKNSITLIFPNNLLLLFQWYYILNKLLYNNKIKMHILIYFVIIIKDCSFSNCAICPSDSC